MAYVRTHGNQLAIVHGERDPETRKVQQRVLFTICSKPEALAAIGRGEEGWPLDRMLEQRYPRVRFNWDKIRAGIEERMDALPDNYPFRAGEVLGRFRNDLCAFTRQLGLADPQCMYSAAELISEHRMELEYLRELIDWRLAVCDQEPDEWNGDNAFFWRHRLQPTDVPPEVVEKMADLYAERDLDRLEALARLFIDCYDDYAEGHNYLGLVAQERGKLEEAIEHFRRAMTEGRKLFPKRLAKKYYWSDLDTRPYMRGMRNLAVALMLLGRYDEALDVCARMEEECDDTLAAASFRAHIYLNMGQWSEAQRDAKRVVGIWPEHAYVAAFAALEQFDRVGAVQCFLHGALTCPRTGRILLGLRTSRPQGGDEIRDHNTGVVEVEYLEAFLARLSRRSRGFFKAIFKAPTTRALLAEVEQVATRRRAQHATHDREAFDRMMRMRSMEFAHEAAERVLPEVMG